MAGVSRRNSDPAGRPAGEREGLDQLSQRERQVLQALAVLGETQLVAHRLGLTRRSGEHVLESVRQKLGVTTSTLAATTAMASGWITGPPGREEAVDEQAIE